jgi:hypothetical protein
MMLRNIVLSPEEYIASYPRDPHKIYYGHGCYLGKYTTSYFYECLKESHESDHFSIVKF